MSPPRSCSDSGCDVLASLIHHSRFISCADARSVSTMEENHQTNAKRSIQLPSYIPDKKATANREVKHDSSPNVRTMSVTLRLVPKKQSSSAEGQSLPDDSDSAQGGAKGGGKRLASEHGENTIKNIQHILEPFVRTALAQKYLRMEAGNDKPGYAGCQSNDEKKQSPPPGVIEMPAFIEKCRFEASRGEQIPSKLPNVSSKKPTPPCKPNIVQDYINSLKRLEIEGNSANFVKRCSIKESSIIPTSSGCDHRPNPGQQQILTTAPGKACNGLVPVIRLNNIDHLVQIKPGTSFVATGSASQKKTTETMRQKVGQRNEGVDADAGRGKDTKTSAPILKTTVHILPGTSNKNATVAKTILKNVEGDGIGPTRSRNVLAQFNKPRQLLQLPGLKSQIRYLFQSFISTLQSIHNFNKVSKLCRLISWRTKFDLQILLMILNGLVMVTVHVLPMRVLKPDSTKDLQKVFQKMVWFLKKSMELVGLFYLHDHGCDPMELQLLGVAGIEVTCILQGECSEKYGSAPKMVHNCMIDVERYAKAYGSKTVNRTARGLLLVENATNILRELKKNNLPEHTLEDLVKLEVKKGDLDSEGNHDPTWDATGVVMAASNPRTADLKANESTSERSEHTSPASAVTATEETFDASTDEEIIDIISCSPDSEMSVIETFSNTSVGEEDVIHGTQKRRMPIKLPFKKRFRTE